MTGERVKRKLSAILSADAVGYSRLMGNDEVSTVKTLEAYRKVMADLIGQFRGRVVDSPRDNLLAEFSSVVDVVQCAVEIHEVIKAKNEELPEDRRMLFRIGVNLGDVIEEGDRIYGDGVNIAARLEGLAEPGGVCISGSAYEQIKNKFALGYEYIGEHKVKNITEPLKVYKVPVGPRFAISKEGKLKKTKLKSWQWTALGAIGLLIIIIGTLAIWNFYFSNPSIEPEQITALSVIDEDPKTIAVLPFDDLSPDRNQEYFVDGLSEEILNFLCQISGLEVMGKTSSFAFKGKNKTAQEISKELDVGYILEGSVRKDGNTLRITAQLLRGDDGFHLWSETYDRELKEIFTVQENIAKAVADKLRVSLGIGESFQQLGGTENIEAYELYLVAKGLADNLQPEQALKKIVKAIELDPNFAMGWAFKAGVHLDLAAFRSPNRTALEFNAAQDAANRAIEIEPKLGESYFALGSLYNDRGEFIKAKKFMEKGLALSLDEWVLAWHYISVGYLKKSKNIFEGLWKKDFLNPEKCSAYILSLGLIDDLQSAEQEYKRVRASFSDQNFFWGDAFLTMLIVGGTEKNLSITDLPQTFMGVNWNIIKANLESPEKGLITFHGLFDNNNSLSSVDYLDGAFGAAYFGDIDFATELVSRALSISQRELWKIWLPVFSDVRKQPQFKKLMTEIGLVDYWKEYDWPDLCHPVGDDDFVCD